MVVFNLKTLREQTVDSAAVVANREQVAGVGLGINVRKFAPVGAVVAVVVALALQETLAVQEIPEVQAIPARRQTLHL
jgi:hypothetical protein